MIYTITAEVVSPSFYTAEPVTKNVKAVTRKRSHRNANNKKRVRKTSNNNNTFLSCHAAIASIAFLLISTLIIFSQLGCFNVHFGLPKSIDDVQISHEADGSYVEMYGSAQIELDAETMQQLKAHTSGPFTLNIDVAEMPSGPNARLPIDAATVRKALLSQRQSMPMPTTMSSLSH
jgi:hypothetical protein